jgi:hypothetical protein
VGVLTALLAGTLLLLLLLPTWPHVGDRLCQVAKVVDVCELLG